ncbi:phosphoribosylformylglycinamidine synthase subunit PurQ [Carboxydothermus ferrireducens]|uniref:Phosphoribosylformylglycinamidine synthase subunit PurQ n=1 Tax=Carboxydothermus ferrireducens DSM 11255 TaxID=1119529 RepID=A0ABX2RA72_9THEO|nr:phosphoribosylformylglycinamidine synthase subunit PurQ [Carboxydothermus ferrireducens]NYE56968.1 phosphoribosylformylglycinamidine synthase [Carboxydothermus ferrireducens DSM 11255]
MRFGVVVFPGSNCDADCFHVLKNVFGRETVYIWHKEDNFDVDCIVLPGGFSYGDYLRAGAIARFSPVMKKVVEFANTGGLVIGICNGFQILLEAGLLPGAMLRNKSINFRCHDVYLRVENASTPFTSKAHEGQVLKIPIAHGEGNYYCEPDTLKKLIANGQVVFRYCNSRGEVTEDANPNGSLYNIAGIINERGNVLGMMPHPERCSEKILGGEDGRVIWESIIAYLERGANRG